MTATTAPTGIARFIPILGWLPKYQSGWLRLDLVAGLTAAAVVIPQAMAYAIDRQAVVDLAFNGAEPVSAQTIRRFQARFGPYGFNSTAMAPVYGLAECSVGLAFPKPGSGMVVDRVEREALTRYGKAVPTEAKETAIEVVACGHPVSGHEIRIVDRAGRELPQRREGRLQFRGPSTTSGYFRNPEKTRELLRAGWLESGDLAYRVEDDIYLTICGLGMGNYKDGRMEQISNAGNGNYFYIDNIREEQKVFV